MMFFRLLVKSLGTKNSVPKSGCRRYSHVYKEMFCWFLHRMKVVDIEAMFVINMFVIISTRYVPFSPPFLTSSN